MRTFFLKNTFFVIRHLYWLAAFKATFL